MKFARLFLFFIVFTSCSSNVKLGKDDVYFTRSGIIFHLTAHKENNIRVNAFLPGHISYDDDLKLEIPVEGTFTKDGNGNYVYGNCTIKPLKDGYTLLINGEEKYSSRFEVFNKKELEEYRDYSKATSFYGMGQSSKTTDLKGGRFNISHTPSYGDQTYMYIPFYISDAMDSVYYNAAGFDSLRFPKTMDDEEVRYSSNTGRVDSYYRLATDYKDAVSSFYTTGDSKSLIPEWAFGFIQSKYGYKTQDEVVQVVERFKKENITISAIVLDLYWFNKMGDLDWNKEKFPDPAGLSKYLNDNGIKLITITEPFFTNDSKNFENFKSKGFFALNEKNEVLTWHDWWCFGASNGAVINPISPGVQETIGEIYSAMIKTGIDGFWTDLGEPEKVPGNALFNTIPERFFHNYFNREWSRIIHDGVKKEFPDKRLFILSRSGYTGSGKYNVSVWTGDVGANFNALKQQIPLGLSAGLSGFSYWGSDVGGFVPEYSSPELMTRWYQFGAFTPVFRAHGTGDREPWSKDEKTTAIIKKYIDYRYMLLPYIYSLAGETYRAGLPIMRPMFMNYVNVPKNVIDKQYMFGDFMLVAPVMGELAFNSTIDVYLPEGTWYDFETMKPYTGGTTITEPVTIEKIPVFVKEGSIIPVSFKKYKNPLIIIPQENGNSVFTAYDDDGVTERYKKGDFIETTYTLSNSSLSFTSNATINEITVLIPSTIEKKGSGWVKDGNFMVKTFTVNDMKGKVELF